MRLCIRSVGVVVLVCLPLLASEPQFGAVPPPRTPDSELLQAPSDLQLPGGAVLPAGAYRVVIRQPLLTYVARPDAPLGFWPGPSIELWPSGRPMLSHQPLLYVELKTATQVKVVYDLPFRLPPDSLRVGLSGGAWTPLIHNGQLSGLRHRDQTLHVTGARRVDCKKPLNRLVPSR
jgi:hypothetical protein